MAPADRLWNLRFSLQLNLADDFALFTIFYTDIMKISPAAISLMFVLDPISFDGVTDLIVGYLIDQTNTRWGKILVPISLFGSYAFLLYLLFLCFNVPEYF